MSDIHALPRMGRHQLRLPCTGSLWKEDVMSKPLLFVILILAVALFAVG